MAIKLKQIDLPTGTTTTAVTDDQALMGTEAAELIAGVDVTGHAQFIATDSNGRVQVADGGDSLTVDSLQLPVALEDGRLSTNVGAWLGSTSPSVGQKPMTGSLPVVLASDQTAVPIAGLGAAGMPVGGIVTVQGGGGVPIEVIVPSLPLPSNAATEVTLAGRLADSTFTTRINTQGAKASSASTPVVLAFDHTAIPVTDNGGSLTVDGAVTVLNFPASQPISDGGGSITIDGAVTVSNFPASQPISAAALPLPSGASTETTLGTRLAESTFTTRVPTVGQKTAAGSSPVVLASDQTAIPVTIAAGAASFGKAEDSVAVSGDTGIPMLAVYQPDAVGVSAGTVGDYATLNVDDKGRLRVAPGAQTILETFESITGFTGIDTDATNIVLSTNHVRGSSAVSFDKADTAANNVYGLIQKTITTTDLSNMALGVTFVQVLMYLPTLTNVRNVIIRLGTDSANYNSWTLPITNATAGIWQVYRAAIGTSNASVGTGWNLAAISYIAVGVEMNLQSNTLPGIVVDGLVIVAGQVNSSDINTEITSVVNTPKVDLSKISGVSTDTNTGTASNGTLRVVSATNDPNLSAISAAQTSGLQKSITRGGAKGSTTAADVTSTASGSNHQPLDVAIYDASGSQVTSFGGVADATASGSVTAINQSVTATLTGHGSGIAQITGTWSGTLQIQGTLDGTNYVAISGRNSSSLASRPSWTPSQLGSNDIIRFAVSGFSSIRVFAIAWTSGTAVVTLRCTAGSAAVTIAEALPGSTSTVSSIGNVVLTDGTNQGVVKASTISPLTTDAALVVTISPNTTNLALPVTPKGSPTGTLSNVAASASSVTLLASNTSRKGAMLVNDSSSTVYVKFGTTASTTSYTVLMAANSYYEVPFAYTGILTGIWTSATGNARVTEIT